jgi:hypothetical protein
VSARRFSPFFKTAVLGQSRGVARAMQHANDDQIPFVGR